MCVRKPVKKKNNICFLEENEKTDNTLMSLWYIYEATASRRLAKLCLETINKRRQLAYVSCCLVSSAKNQC